MSAAVVLLSGGLDSTVNLKRALDEGGVSLALTLDYGQIAAAREICAARDMCERFGVSHRTVELPWLAQGQDAAILARGKDIPSPRLEDLDDAAGASRRSADRVWVANRNGVFLNVGAAFAESLCAADVVVGFNREEAATFPDNTPEFLEAANRCFAFSTRGAVRARCYTSDMDKAQVLSMGLEIGAPLDLVWPCYRCGGRLCGRCESCMRFLRAVRRASAGQWFASRHSGLPEDFDAS